MIDLSARNRLAQELTAQFRTRYGDRLLLAGLYGSTLRGEVTEWSDLDLLVVLRDAAGPPSRSFVLQGLTLDLLIVPLERLEADLREPGLAWPRWMGMLAELRPLAGETATLTRWRELGMALDEQQFLIAAARHLPQLVFPTYGRIRSSAARGAWRDALPAASALVYELQQSLCLLNRRWVTRAGYAGLEQSFSLPLCPEGYARLATELLAAHELQTIVPLAGALVAAYWRLLVTHSMAPPNYQRVDQLPL